MKLVIVESPTKAKTIGRFLGDGYTIRASMGHVMDLPKSKLGVDLDNNFQPQYEISPDKKKTITELKKLSKDADEIILATDPDREGEAISGHIKELLEDGKNKKKFVRIVFHEITKDAITEALTHKGDVNTHLVDAQTARRVLDRLVGYKLSPILWQKVRRGLSAGRVQSVALRLIVEREKEIQKFEKEPYWTITVGLSKAKEKTPVDFELIEINGEKLEKQKSFKLYDGDYKVTLTTLSTQIKSEEVVADLKTKTYTVEEVLQKQSKRSPVPPFTTSTLQQDASRRFGFSGRRTMSLAQKLYEEGYITYHRTDSVNLAVSAVTSMREYIEKTFDKRYLPDSPRVYSTKQKLAQEAHEAIRPTHVGKTMEVVEGDLGRDFAKLYDLIWRRAVASQMADAQIESTTVFVKADGGTSKEVYRLKTNGSVLVFDGFLKVTPYTLGDRNLPQFEALEILTQQTVLSEAHETPPPPRYNDASLIGTLEDAGIGRPSTYASIIATIETRKYIERDQAKFIPTTIGIAVTDFLVANFADIDDIPFTAQMEDELDAIANDGKDWVPMMKEFYTPFAAKLKDVAKAARVEIPVEETGEKCPKDDAPLVIRMGRFGKFISCKNFPTCDFKKAFIEETNFTCPKDGGKVIAKKTRKGRTFYGCSNYPNCDFAVWKLQDLKNGTWDKPKPAKTTATKPAAKKTTGKKSAPKKTAKK
ncbi:MAG TPA: type I DNA topoisomerase [Patescibacteria group bacterium]|nr:type I DNA topoisomerase [Patescibacteria group bacterium]